MPPLHLAAALILISSVDILTTGLDATKKAEIVLKQLKNRRRPFNVRLRGGKSPEEGNVEINHNGVWGSVCDDEWDINDGKVVCRQLGYRSAYRVTYNSQFGHPAGKYLMDNVYCDGTESGLAKCRFDGWGINDCGSDEAAGVICDKKTEKNIENVTANKLAQLEDSPRTKPLIEMLSLPNFQIRLAGGREPHEGRVEVQSGVNGEETCSPHVPINLIPEFSSLHMK